MPCEPIIENGKITGFICSRSREKPKPKPCYKCGKPSTKLCDFRDYKTMTFKEHGRKVDGEVASFTTCDKAMCDDCANHYEEDTDFCDEHNNEISIYRTDQGERVYKELLKKCGIGE